MSQLSTDPMLHPEERLSLDAVPVSSFEAFQATLIRKSKRGGRLASLFGMREGESVRLFAALAFDRDGVLQLSSTLVGKTFPSLTPECPEAHLFEREIAEQFGITPLLHPWLKRVRHCGPFKPTDFHKPSPDIPGTGPFFAMTGEDIHEVAVGPVHAGIIEPGHFRFQCNGETVYHLEINLGYQHRGIEAALEKNDPLKNIHYAQTLCGDTTIGHTLAFCQTEETLSGCVVPARAQALRGIALELERLANHVGDLGAIAGDIAFLPTAAYCGRIRGDFLNMTALLCGNRFGRNFIVPGGIKVDVDAERTQTLLKRLDLAVKDAENAINLLWQSGSSIDFLRDNGTLSFALCESLGLVGPAARACGAERDVRFDFPSGIYRMTQIPCSVMDSCDVFARAMVRYMEIERSAAFIREWLQNLPEGDFRGALPPKKPNSLTVSLVEGWRGEICHTAITDHSGKYQRYKVVDPSFHNWQGLAMAMRGEQISHFPVNNKSFNLSYCGFDL